MSEKKTNKINSDRLESDRVESDQIGTKFDGDLAFVSLRKGKRIEGKELSQQHSMPELSKFCIPKAQSLEQQNGFQSASAFIESIANEALVWKDALPEGHSPKVLAFLYGGMSINVKNLTKVSFSGIRIEGEYNGEPCALLAHQSTVQILCYGPKIKAEVKKMPIGFFWDENELEV
jgi:hypothetical protein